MAASEEEYVVEKILQEKCVKGKVQYLVKWEGYEAIEDQTWEPAVHMANTEALMAWKKGKAKTPGNVPASSKTPGKGTVGEYDDGNDEEEEDSEADGGEWKPKATSASRSEPAKKKTTPKVAASGKSPATAAAASKKRPLEEVLPEALPEKLDVQVILSQIEGWDAPALKALASALSKEANGSTHRWHQPLSGLKGTGKKAEVLEDIAVAVRSAYAGMGTRECRRCFSYPGGTPPPEAKFHSERIESHPLSVGTTPAALLAAVEKAFRRSHEAAANAKTKKAFRPETKMLMQRLQVLEQAQLAQIICSLVDGGHVNDEAVLTLIPSADLEPMLKECQKLVNAISRALPNSRWGSCTDHYGYKRCASAVNTAKRKILEGAKQFKGAKQWSTAKEYADRALPIAREMVVFDCDGDNGARDSVISELKKLQQEAAGHLNLAMVD